MTSRKITLLTGRSEVHDRACIKTAVGRHTPKVKSGCRTCKARKVKCDETFPTCTRCIRAGRECGGYGVWGGGNSLTNPAIRAKPTQQNDISKPKLPIPRAGRSMRGNAYVIGVGSDVTMHKALNDAIPARVQDFRLSTRDKELMLWFNEVATTKLPGLFSSYFWNSLLPQAYYSEPLILDGVLALASAHQQAMFDKPGSFGHHQARVYGNAVSHLRPKRNDVARSVELTLISCILFICLEMVQHRRDLVIAHVQNGMKLISSAPYKGSTECNAIAKELLNFSTQVNMLGCSQIPQKIIVEKHANATLPSLFESVEEARQFLDRMLARSMEVTHLFREQFDSGVKDSAASRKLEELQGCLKSWLHVLDKSGLDMPSSEPRIRAGCLTVRMYHTIATIITHVAPFPYQEARFDDVTDLFIAIMSHAIKLWNAVANVHASTTPLTAGDSTGTIIDLAWIPAVYYVGVKCRVRRVRTHAIRLLEATHHTEGIWDARISALVVKEVMRVEEGELAVQRIYDSNFLLTETPKVEVTECSLVSEGKRVHDVGIMHSSEGSVNDVSVRYRKRHGEGWQTYIGTYDRNANSWAYE